MRINILIAIFYILRLVGGYNPSMEFSTMPPDTKPLQSEPTRVAQYVTKSLTEQIYGSNDIEDEDSHDDQDNQIWTLETGFSALRSNGVPSGGERFRKNSRDMGLCTRHHEMIFICDCHRSPGYDYTTRIECWIFAKHLTANDKDWDRFAWHVNIKNLSLIVQTSGAMDFIPSQLFTQLIKLETINIQRVNVTKLYANTFRRSESLRLLQITNNRIKILGSRSIASLPNVTEINLGYNHIHDIEEYAFMDLPNLEELYMGFNDLSVLGKSLFQGAGNLLILDLSHNRIQEFQNGTFENLSKLQSLRMDFNELTELPNHLFTELWSLVDLNLDNNRIMAISNRAFDGLANMYEISMRYNMIVELADDIFHGTPALTVIHLEHNRLVTTKNETWQPIWDNFKRNGSLIGLSDNNLYCHCNLEWIYDMRDSTDSESVLNALNDLRCLMDNTSAPHYAVPTTPCYLFFQQNDDFSITMHSSDQSLQDSYEAGGGYYYDHHNESDRFRSIYFPDQPKNQETLQLLESLRNDKELMSWARNDTNGTDIAIRVLAAKREYFICTTQYNDSTTALPDQNANSVESLLMPRAFILPFVIIFSVVVLVIA